MSDRARFFIWRQNGKIVAFSFCLVCGDAIYDECIGLDYSVALDLHLYFYTLRDIISWSLQQGLKYYYSNPLNYEPKLHLDCELVPLDLYIMRTESAAESDLSSSDQIPRADAARSSLAEISNANQLDERSDHVVGRAVPCTSKTRRARSDAPYQARFKIGCGAFIAR